MSASAEDPMAAILARYERFEGHPLDRLTGAVRAGGMRITDTRMGHVGVVKEVAHDGMCVGYISRAADRTHVLELNRKEVPAEMIAAAAQSIERSTRNAATHAMRAGMAMGLA